MQFSQKKSIDAPVLFCSFLLFAVILVGVFFLCLVSLLLTTDFPFS